ncbi:MAG: aspartate aminotransferase family protein [Steroidobacteraceae bacterium]|jgi:4-aminobutyrate--pyruvate transaminase
MIPLGNSLTRRDIASVLHPYTNLRDHQKKGPLIITRGRGVHVYDDDGKEYIEGLAGLWCASLGFSEPRLTEAAQRQMAILPYYHVFTHKSHEPSIELAERLLKLLPAPMSKVFFNCSGSEANDTAIKIIWYYNNALGRPKKKKILSRLRAYHGVTVAAGSLTGLPNNHRDFDLPIANFLHVGCPHYYRFARIGESEEDFASRLASELDQLIVNEGADTVAAFFAEPVMGAGGVLVPPKGYFDKIQKVLRKHDVLLVADEVICGFGRVGTMFAIETYGMQPDIITLGKQMSSGYLPISATIISNPIFEALVAESDKIGLFAHGFTHSGHPVAAAVAVETLKIYEERHILDHVRAIAPHFQDRLRGLYSHPLIGEARGVGLLGALELVRDKPNKEPFDPALKVGDLAFELAQEEGLIVRAIGDSLAVCPPLIINDAEIDELFNRLSRALDRTHVELRRRATDAEPTAVPRIARA